MKNLVYCLDGTTNEYDSAYPTNVVMMHKSIAAMDRNGVRQHAYYDAGVGTQPGQRLLGMAFGYGLWKNVMEAYVDLCRNYEPGDQIHIAGFSRGAYTARSLAGLIGFMGIVDDPSPENIKRVDYFYKRRLKASASVEADLNEWRARHSTRVCANEKDREFRLSSTDPVGIVPDIIQIAFIGVWDTVKTVGLNERNYDWHDHDLSKHVRSARHAIAIDERRRKFNVTPWDNIDILNQYAANEGRTDNPYQQKFFPGTHGSIGGGGPVKGLSDEVFQWVRDGAAKAGVAFLTTGDSELFALQPNPLDWLDNVVGKPMTRWQKLMSKVSAFGVGIFGHQDRKGPKSLDEVSQTAKIRYFADPKVLPEGQPYRPGTLENVSVLLQQQGSPFSEADYQKLVEKNDLVNSGVGDEKLIEVSGVAYRIHRVKKGESLSLIAKEHYGDPTLWRQIFEANRMTIVDPNKVYVSQNILVPVKPLHADNDEGAPGDAWTA